MWIYSNWSNLCLKLQESQFVPDLLRLVLGLLLGLCLSLVKVPDRCHQLSWDVNTFICSYASFKKEKVWNWLKKIMQLKSLCVCLCLPSVPFRCNRTAEGRNCCHFRFMTRYRTTNCSCSRERSKAVEPQGYIPNRKRHTRPRSEGDTPPW